MRESLLTQRERIVIDGARLHSIERHITKQPLIERPYARLAAIIGMVEDGCRSVVATTTTDAIVRRVEQRERRLFRG